MSDSLESLPFFIALTGPTASGKTAAALGIAQEIDCEIVSVDSALVYRGMDIGTGKPTPSELSSAAHHLINIRWPHEPYSASKFIADAKRLIKEISARGKLPLLVGGTMLYFNVLRQGLSTLPSADESIRAAIESRAKQVGWPTLHAELAQLDPTTADRLSPNDSQRIQRALEVYRMTGSPISEFQQRQSRPSLNFPIISLEPRSRIWLHQRIVQRINMMWQQGFIEEVEQLKKDPALTADLPSMRSVGYRQIWQALEGEISLEEAQDKTLFATRQLAKRQITWLRAMPYRHVIACDDDLSFHQLSAVIKSLR